MSQNESTGAKLRNWMALGFSAVAVLLSSISAYFTFLQGPRISVSPGELVTLINLPKNLEIRVPLTFVNEGARLGTVQKLALTIRPPDAGRVYVLEPLYFEGLDDDGDFKHKRLIGPIPVPAKSTVAEHILFVTSREGGDDFRLTLEGIHLVTVLGWQSSRDPPRLRESFALDVQPEHLAALDRQLKTKKANADTEVESVGLWLMRWRDWRPRYLSDEEADSFHRESSYVRYLTNK